MERKISMNLLLISMISSILCTILFMGTFYKTIEVQVIGDLQQMAQLVETGAEDKSKFSNTRARVTVVAPDGRVLSDSAVDSETMENHLDRKEISDALRNGTGQSKRFSKTLGKTIFYYAVKMDDGNILRVSTQTDSVREVLLSSMPYILMILLVIFALSAFIAPMLTKAVVKPIKQLSEEIDSTGGDEYTYEELAPFVRKIKSQRAEIVSQLEKLRAEKEKLSTLMENMSEGLLVFDVNKNAVLINESACAILDTDNDAVGENILYITRNHDIVECVQSAESGRHAGCMLSENGRKYRVTASPVMQKDKQNGVVCLIIDVTEKVEIEKLRQEFTANVSHELKTPLTSVSGYAELIESGIAKPDDVTAFAKKIRIEASRMLALIGDILKLSNLDEAQTIDDFSQVDMLKLALDTADSLEFIADEFGVNVIVSGGGFTVGGDEQKLSQLCYNLCENAIRYNKPGGSVKITVEDKKLVVEDTGIGIPKDKQRRVFERFYRVDKSRSKQTGGTGLGLAIVKHIAAQHHAQITLESTEGAGTKITVAF